MRTRSVWFSPPPHPRRRNDNEGGRQVKAEAMKRAITMATRVESNDDGNGNKGKSNGNGNEGAGRATTRAMAVATTVAVMRVATNKEGEGGKAIETVTRLVGEQRGRQQKGQW